MSYDPAELVAELNRRRSLERYADLVPYAEECLTIRTKEARLAPFRFNRAQLILHEAAERQWAEHGRVRLLVPKGRQLGVSTYVGGRFYRKVGFDLAGSCFILTHEDKATQNLFRMVRTFHDNVPDAFRNSATTDNANELIFGETSGYALATARTRGAGRSTTMQMFHGSECGFWLNATDHWGGIRDTIPQDGSEIILESTGNGQSGLFYDMTMEAQDGGSDFEVVFLPWFLADEYRRQAPDDWTAPEAWAEYAAAHHLDAQQLYWAYMTNAEKATATGKTKSEPCWLFRQEYPAILGECFQQPAHDSFISAENVLRARKSDIPDDATAPLVLGVDVGLTQDRTRIVDRQGRCAGRLIDEEYRSNDTMAIVGFVSRLIDKINPQMTFIDVIGIGKGVHDRLKEQGYKVRGVNFGQQTGLEEGVKNKRAECYRRLRDWIDQPGGVSIPDTDEYSVDLTAAGYTFDSSGKLLLESKEDIRSRIKRSPDAGDALSLTFAEHIVSQAVSSYRSLPTQASDMNYEM